MATPPKSKPAVDGGGDDVILFMDEFPATNNGFGLPDLLGSDNEEEEEEIIETMSSSIVAETPTQKLEVANSSSSVVLYNNNNNSNGREALSSRLLETDNTNNPRPEHGPEIDDLEPELIGGPRHEHYPGIDDGLLPEPDDEKPSMQHLDVLDDVLALTNTITDPDNVFFTSSQGPSPTPRLRPDDYPTTYPGFAPAATPTPDMNVYQQKKTIAQGMMDLALISANANQFRYVLQSSGRHPYYYPSLAMIGLSLFLQVVVGIGLIWNSTYNVKVDAQMCKANRANNWTVIAIFLVTILNVFISSFGVVEAASETIFASGST